MGEWRVIERAGRDRLGEGLLWSGREGALYWTDILASRLHRMALASGEIECWTMPEMIGWVVERRDGPGLIAGLQSAIVALTLDPLTVEPIARPEPDLPNNRRNDANADAWGRIWAGSMDVGGKRKTGSLWRLDADGSVHRADPGYYICNGPAFSPDGRTLYHTDTARGLVYRFDLSADGTLGERSVFLSFDGSEGRPDGMTVDSEGGLWIALWGGSRVSRYTSDGVFDRSIALPASQITNCTFAGAALDRMFVTSAAEGREDEPLAGALFEIDPGAVGLPAGLYAG